MDINESVEIKFVGKNTTIFNVVSFAQFEKVYKPKGWVLKDNSVLDQVKEEKKEEVVDIIKQPIEKVIEELKTTNENEIKNMNTAKKKANTNVDFNDKIMKE